MKTLRLLGDAFFSGPGSEIAVYRLVSQEAMRTHGHDFWEIVFILSGAGIHSTGETRHPVGAGDVLVINKRRSHAYEDTKNLSLVNVLLRDGIVREVGHELGGLPGFHALFTLEPSRWRRKDFRARQRLDSADLARAETYIRAIEGEIAKSRQGGLALARHWLFILVGFLARKHAEAPAHEGDWRMAKLLSRIRREPQRPLTVASLAREAAMSERSFLRHFREATGHSPLDYVLRARIRLACALLEDASSDLPITEIAFRSGFEDSNYFSRQFRRFVGHSPRQHRKGK